MTDTWDFVVEEAARFALDVAGGPTARAIDAGEIRARIAALTGEFENPRAIAELMPEIASLMRKGGVQAEHPRHFGFFNPSVLPDAALGAALAAIWNPQLAINDYAPVANEIEQQVLRWCMRRIGFDPETSCATFATGGAEANLQALLAALARSCPRWLEEGLRGLPRPPMVYLSEAGHDSFFKLVRVAGLGRSALRLIPVDGDQRLRPDLLRARMHRDRELGRLPLMIVGTAGTTAAGAIDPLPELRAIADAFGAFLHVDAAWGGTALLSRRLRPLLLGIEQADSVTWDAHKWLSVPMGAGMFFCRHPDAMARAFSVRSGLAPGRSSTTVDPFLATIQWSRRFIGLPLFFALAALGAEGYEALIDRQVELAERLRELLAEAGFEVVPGTALPTVCFSHPMIAEGRQSAAEVVRALAASGEAFIASVKILEPKREVLRACITNRRTNENDLRILVEALLRAFDR